MSLLRRANRNNVYVVETPIKRVGKVSRLRQLLKQTVFVARHDERFACNHIHVFAQSLMPTCHFDGLILPVEIRAGNDDPHFP